MILESSIGESTFGNPKRKWYLESIRHRPIVTALPVAPALAYAPKNAHQLFKWFLGPSHLVGRHVPSGKKYFRHPRRVRQPRTQQFFRLVLHVVLDAANVRALAFDDQVRCSPISVI